MRTINDYLYMINGLDESLLMPKASILNHRSAIRNNWSLRILIIYRIHATCSVIGRFAHCFIIDRTLSVANLELIFQSSQP
jgi:hypothetical protein